MNNSPPPTFPQLDIRYGQQAALYTSQFLLSAGAEELTLDCTSGIDARDGESTLVPVHTRLALSWGAAERLATLLNQALAQRDAQRDAQPSHGHVPHRGNGESDAAKLPSFGGAHA